MGLVMLEACMMSLDAMESTHLVSPLTKKEALVRSHTETKEHKYYKFMVRYCRICVFRNRLHYKSQSTLN